MRYVVTVKVVGGGNDAVVYHRLFLVTIVGTRLNQWTKSITKATKFTSIDEAIPHALQHDAAVVCYNNRSWSRL